ncbi:Na-translocating system protein MpsC family protein [Margalitia sp. FSL K6-0131]|uniref:Na-translocating system protein MpsC family protein n=1 Tax=Margalitia sp. FSL K6-0131 TaxID=2954604 RepID=UPI0030F893ED
MLQTKIKDLNTFELEFLNFINNYIKRNGGKGPRQTEVKFMGDTIVYFIRGILTEREKKLIHDPEGKKIVMEARRIFMELDKKHRMEVFENFIGCKIIENYESWNLEQDSAVCVLLLENKIF